MDLAYLRAHPHHLPTFLAHQRIRETPVPGGSSCQARRLTLEDGVSVFAKTWPERAATPAPEHFFETEAAGLRWLREAAAVPVPEVIAIGPGLLALEWIDTTGPTRAAAARFGRDLARLHRAGADRFGAPWPGFIGSLPQDNGGSEVDWPDWFARRRLYPYLRRSADNGALAASDVALVERLISDLGRYAGPPEPPARLHGDLWPGNLLWAGPVVYLVDPAAHGGHRETDLAQLALFGGAPHLDAILAAYDAEYPLAAGWRDRVPVHQLSLLLAHTALFGAGYRDGVLRATQTALSIGS